MRWKVFIRISIIIKYNKKNIDLYRDDGLAIFKNISGPKLGKVKKYIRKLWEENQLDTVIQCSMKTVNYLHVVTLTKKKVIK